MPRKAWTTAVATFFGMGFIPLVPATWASAAAAALAWVLPGPLEAWVLALSAAGFSVCRESQKVFLSADPKQFVMDEVCGMMLSVLWLPKNFYVYLCAFILFRVLDSCKPWPISRIQDSPRTASIMWDDLAAGFFTNLLLQAALRAPWRHGA